MSNKKTKNNTSGLIYLSNLAREHEICARTYVSIMEQYDGYLMDKYNFNVTSLKAAKKRPYLKPWQAVLFRRLNPTNFEIESMKELNEFDKWLEFIKEVNTYIKNETH